MGLLSLFGFGKPLAAGAIVLACGCLSPDPSPEEVDGLLRQAAQHFADLEDDKAKSILDALAEHGVAEADVLLGYLHSDPLYEERDYERAVVAFEDAAARGNAEALFQVAESRFWPNYSDWTLTAVEEAVRPTLEESLSLLRQVKEERHHATSWRLAHLCVFESYRCSPEDTDAVIEGARKIMGDNLYSISGSFKMTRIWRSGEAEETENAKLLETHLLLGYAVADPFVAGVTTDRVWREITTLDQCPDPDYIDAVGRLFVAMNAAVISQKDRMKFEDCYDDEQIAVMKQKLGSLLDGAVRTYSNENAWAARWCYETLEWPAIGQCLVTSVRDHYFACTKLSLPKYYDRFDIEYRKSKRYERCRSQMASFEG